MSHLLQQFEAVYTGKLNTLLNSWFGTFDAMVHPKTGLVSSTDFVLSAQRPGVLVQVYLEGTSASMFIFMDQNAASYFSRQLAGLPTSARSYDDHVLSKLELAILKDCFSEFVSVFAEVWCPRFPLAYSLVDIQNMPASFPCLIPEDTLAFYTSQIHGDGNVGVLELAFAEGFENLVSSVFDRSDKQKTVSAEVSNDATKVVIKKLDNLLESMEKPKVRNSLVNYAEPSDPEEYREVLKKLRALDSRILAHEMTERLLSGDVDKRLGAAHLAVILGVEKTASIFLALDHDRRLQLTFEIARLEYLDEAKVASVLAHYSSLVESKPRFFGGIDLVRDMLELGLGSESAVDIINELTANLNAEPFSFVRTNDPELVSMVLSAEAPYVIASILACLEPRIAAVVLNQLETGLGAEVVLCMASLKPLRPSTIRKLEEALEELLIEKSDNNSIQVGGVDFVAEVLGIVPEEKENTLLLDLNTRDSDLANAIRAAAASMETTET